MTNPIVERIVNHIWSPEFLELRLKSLSEDDEKVVDPYMKVLMRKFWTSYVRADTMQGNFREMLWCIECEQVIWAGYSYVCTICESVGWCEDCRGAGGGHSNCSFVCRDCCDTKHLPGKYNEGIHCETCGRVRCRGKDSDEESSDQSCDE